MLNLFTFVLELILKCFKWSHQCSVGLMSIYVLLIYEHGNPTAYHTAVVGIPWLACFSREHVIILQRLKRLPLLCCIVCPVLPCAALCCLVLPCAALYCPVLPCVALCCPVLPCAALCCPVLPCAALCCPVLPCAALCYPVLPYPTPQSTLSYLVLTCPTLSFPYLVLPCATMCYSVLPCAAL
jgi:hypothetical protein